MQDCRSVTLDRTADTDTAAQPSWLRLAQLDPDSLGPREEDVKFKFVAPFLRLLGFEDTECSFETPADLGRIDITISGFPAGLIIECKAPHVRLEGYVPQLEKYVRDTMTRKHEAMIALLTNGERMLLFGVVEAIHKNELAGHFLLEAYRSQLADLSIRSTLLQLIGRNALDSGTVRETVESLLRDRRAEEQRRNEIDSKRRELDAEKAALTQRLREVENELAQLEPPIRNAPSPGVQGLSSENANDGFKWSREFGSTETVCGWISDVLAALVPATSSRKISQPELAAKLSEFLEGRGTERAKALSAGERLKYAGNMVDWITARWTTGLGGKGSPKMQTDPGAEVTDVKEKSWLREFTRMWKRERASTWSFMRR